MLPRTSTCAVMCLKVRPWTDSSLLLLSRPILGLSAPIFKSSVPLIANLTIDPTLEFEFVSNLISESLIVVIGLVGILMLTCVVSFSLSDSESTSFRAALIRLIFLLFFFTAGAVLGGSRLGQRSCFCSASCLLWISICYASFAKWSSFCSFSFRAWSHQNRGERCS